MFLNGCTIEEYVDLQVRDSHAAGYAEGHAEEHLNSLKALVNSLRPYIPDINGVLEAVRRNDGYENTTKDMIEEFWKERQ